ncbi:MAG: hypothetical protein IJY41_02205 [Clostridia bacterium]|nr:hypothetical protein [Clostridia bacterium]
MDREYTNEELNEVEATEDVVATEEAAKEVVEDVEATEEVEAEQDETDAAMASFLSGSNDYEVKKEEEESEEVKAGKKNILIAALAVIALAVFSISTYGSCVLAAIAIALVLVIKPERLVTHTVVANSLVLGTCVVVKSLLTAVRAIATPIFAFMGSTTTAYSNFTGVLTIFDYILVAVSFVIFVVNAFALMSKKTTAIFGKTADKLC